MAPTSFPKRRSPGPMARGLSLARRLDAIDVPYFSARSGGYVVKKSGEFTDMRRDQEPPPVTLFTYLWGDVLTVSFIETGSYNPEQGLRRLAQYGSVIGGTYMLPTSFNFYVGADYLLRLASDGADTYWPVLVRPTLGDEYPPSPANAGRSISLFSTARLEGGVSLNEYARGLSLCTPGWDGSGYAFCFGGLFQYTGTRPVLLNGGPFDGQTAIEFHTQEYRLWAGRTGNFGVTPNVLGEPNRHSSIARAQVGGPGIALALQTTGEELGSTAWVQTDDPDPGDGYYTGTLKPFVPPRIWRSTNHGLSWASSDATFLDPYLQFGVNFGPLAGPWELHFANFSSIDRPSHKNEQLATFALGARFIYCGNDTVLLIVPQCRMGGTAPDEQFATLLFRSTDAGASFSRIPWPADAWLHGEYTVPLPRVTSVVGYAYHVHWSMGDGHAFVPTKHADGVRMLYTQDYGSTWNLSPPIPQAYIPALTDACFPTVIAPAVCVLSAFDEGGAKIDFGRAGPTFASVTPIGSVAVGSAGDPPIDDLIGYAGHTFAYVADGVNKPRRVHPAFPGEFDQP